MAEQQDFLEMFELEEPKTIKDFVLGLEKIASEYANTDMAKQQMYNYSLFFPNLMKEFASKLDIMTREDYFKQLINIKKRARTGVKAGQKSQARQAGFEIMWDYLLQQAKMSESVDFKLKTLLKEMNFKGEMLLLKNTEKAPNMGNKYGQDVEPSGFYCLKYTPNQKHFLDNPKYKLFKVNLQNPLVIKITDTTLISWKRDLADQYKAKKSALTSKLKSKGYDAIITTYDDSGNDTGEIIILDTTKLKEIDKPDV